MVRVINQETFDGVVKENIEEFDMTVEEAIEEAVQQFEAQGVNLSNIVKTVAMAQGRDPLVACIAQLQDLLKLKSAAAVSFTDHLNKLKSECQQDLARKMLAGKQGAYNVVLDVLDKFSNEESTVVLCLQTLTALMDGFPDLLDKRGVATITSLLTTSKSTAIIENTLRWARVCCVNHEFNRQIIMDNGVISPLRSLVEREEASLLSQICALVRGLTLDDDIRAQVSKAHTHASSLAIEMLCPITKLLAKHKTSKSLVIELLTTMNCLIVRNEFCATVEENGGIPIAMDVLTEYPDDEKIVKNGLMLLKCLAGNDDVKKKIVEAGAPTLVLLAMNRHQKSVAVCNAGLSCVTILSLRSQETSKLFVDQGGPEIILQIMKIHSSALKVQRNCCWAIRNIASRNPNLRQAFLKLGAEELINLALYEHKEIEYDAKSALRDLDCKVELNEQWKGKGVQMDN